MASETSDLLEFVAAMGGERQLRVEESLGQGFVVLRVSEAERRQAKHDIRCVEDVVIELLRNARDAGARSIYLAFAREGDLRTLVMLDDGCGIPPELHERVFDARVTSKLESFHMDRWGMHGRGMALFSVRENAREARVTASGLGQGTAIRVVCDATELAERADQSSWPELSRDEAGEPTLGRGPHNIVRTCCEFALEERGRCEVFVGSPAEVMATARRRMRSTRDAAGPLPAEGPEGLSVLERLRYARDARELRAWGAGLGLEVSERTAHRVMAGEVRPLRSVYERLSHAAGPAEAPRELDLVRDRRGLRLDRADVEAFSRLMERDFAYLAERYYVSLTAAPKVRYAKGRLHVTFELEVDD